MPENTNIHPETLPPERTSFEEDLLYRSLEAQGRPADDLHLPEPTPRSEWLLKEAGYDTILHGLLRSVEENETTWSQARRAGLPQPEYYARMDDYDLARWGLDKAIKRRQNELAEKRKHL